MKQRYEEIDIMRGVSIIAMVIIHTAAYYLNNPTIFALWDVLEFAVPIFVFCSGYLFYKQEYHKHISHSLAYFKKRLGRMLIPYYYALLVYIPLIAIAEPHRITPEFLLKNLTVTGGIDFNWMVLLFLQLSFLMPLLLFMMTRQRRAFIAYVVLTAISTIIFLFFPAREHSRILMGPPWSLIILFSWLVAKYETHMRKLAILFAASAIMFYFTMWMRWTLGLPVDQYANKYPPNLLHLSYGFMSIIGLWHVAHVLKKSHGHVRHLIAFFSNYSYTIFLIHIVVMYVITTVFKVKPATLGFPVFTAQVFILTVAVQLAINYVQRFSTLKRGPTI